MRRVVSYCKRHLAQEAHLKETKSPEELEKTKSTRSLKNWVGRVRVTEHPPFQAPRLLPDLLDGTKSARR